MKFTQVGFAILAVALVGCGSSETSSADINSAAKELASKGANTPSAPPMKTFGGGGGGAANPGVALKPHR